MKTLSVVIPIYNEKKTLLKILDAVEKSVVGDLQKEIILVDDCSTDGTRDMLRDLQKLGKYKIFFQEKNQGKGSALRTGFSRATGDIVLIQDADLEYDPSEYAELISPILLGKADVVYGSRFVGDKPHRVLFFWHYLANRFLTLFSNVFTQLNLTDMETCYKVFTREALQKILPHLQSNRFGIEPEITGLVAEHKFRIYEVGISYSGRTYEEGKKINWKDGLSALWTIIKTKYRFTSFGRDRYKAWLVPVFLFLSVFSIWFLQPKIAGDSISYVESMQFLQTGVRSADFVPNRIITTSGGMYSVLAINDVIDNIPLSWLLLNSFLYLLMGICFYSLLKKLFHNSSTAFFGTLFLVANYSAVTFGLAYLMDIGGWFFYILSLYFSFNYFETKKTNWLWFSALAVGVGGLFKEYALLAYTIIFLLILIENAGFKNPLKSYLFRGLRKAGSRDLRNFSAEKYPYPEKDMMRKGLFTWLLSFGPFLFVNVYSYFTYGYTYLSWLSAQSKYVYDSRLIEYIKSFGSLYNFGWFLFVPSLYWLWKERKQYVFIWLVILSVLPISLWTAITQRVLFIVVPALVMISCFSIKKLCAKNTTKWLILIPLLTLSILCAYLMDSFILNFVNLPF